MASADEDRRSPGTGSFPGGSPRLPRLNGRTSAAGIQASDDEPPVMFVTGGFVEDELTRARRSRRRRDEDPDPPEEPVYASFNDYSPTESLFFHPAGRHEHEVPEEVEDAGPPTPYALLGVSPDATWKEIKSAHRALLSELHPDRFVTATDAERNDAAERLAEVNLAFHTLDKERRAS